MDIYSSIALSIHIANNEGLRIFNTNFDSQDEAKLFTYSIK